MSKPKTKNHYWRDHSWMLIFVVFSVAFVAATITIVIISMEDTHNNIPEKIDVVLYANSEQDVRYNRYKHQVSAVRTYMPWVNHIFVLSNRVTDIQLNSELSITFIPFQKTQKEAFEYMVNIPHIQDHSLFLSDMTFPARAVKRKYLFYRGHPRLFNTLRDPVDMEVMNKYMELPTIPCMVVDLRKLREIGTLEELMYMFVTEHTAILRTDMNKDIFISSNLLKNTRKQLEYANKKKPLFITFHVSDHNADKQVANSMLLSHLEREFKS